MFTAALSSQTPKICLAPLKDMRNGTARRTQPRVLGVDLTRTMYAFEAPIPRVPGRPCATALEPFGILSSPCLTAAAFQYPFRYISQLLCPET